VISLFRSCRELFAASHSDRHYPAAIFRSASLIPYDYAESHDFDSVFETLTRLHVSGLVIAPSNFFSAHAEVLAELTVRRRLPAVYQFRRFVAAGGLMSYGSNELEYYRLVGTYAGKILRGDKPADLPVQQSTKLELMINLKTAKALGLTIPIPLLGRADETIE
jgi:putative tryptophan/tyrosine transport system substrate-binding protein